MIGDSFYMIKGQILPEQYSKILLYSLFAIVCLYSISKGLKSKEISDFYTFWFAGRNFWTGNELYFNTNGQHLRGYLYPPISAGILSLFTFSFLPHKVAAVLFSIIQVVMMVTCLRISIMIINSFSKVAVKKSSVFFSVLLLLPFFGNTINLLQANFILLLFILLFIKAYINEKNLASGFFLALAIMFKVLPVLFLPWLVIRGNKRVLINTTLFMLIMFLIPFAIRGYDQSIKDYQGMYLSLEKKIPTFENADYKPTDKGISLRTTLYNFLNRAYLNPHDTPAPEIIMNVSILFVSLLYVAWLILLRALRTNLSEKEFALIFLFIPIISAATESHHLVILFFPLLALLHNFGQTNKILYWTTFMLGLFFVLTGRDIIGAPAKDWIYEYGFYTFDLIALCALSTYLSLSRANNNQTPQKAIQ